MTAGVGITGISAGTAGMGGDTTFLCGLPQVGCGSGVGAALAWTNCLPLALADDIDIIPAGVGGWMGGGDGAECSLIPMLMPMPNRFLNEEEEAEEEDGFGGTA